jgi:hypothetical protein
VIDNTDLANLETRTRHLINEETARLWTSAMVRQGLNDEMGRLARKIIDLDVGYFETSKTYTPAATLTLPVNCFTVRNVEAYVSDVWYPVVWIGAHNREQYQSTGASPNPLSLAVRFTESALVFEGGISNVSSMRVQYARTPVPMLYETISSADATTFVLSAGSYFDDVYIGDSGVIAAGLGTGQTFTVTDYVASTKTFTVAAWGVNPDSTSVAAWLLPAPLDKWADVVCIGAAIRLLGRRRDSEAASVLMTQYQNDLGEMMTSLAQRQTDQSRHINFTPDWSE